MQTKSMQVADTQINAAIKGEIFPSALTHIDKQEVHSGPFKLFHRDNIAFFWKQRNANKMLTVAKSAVFMSQDKNVFALSLSLSFFFVLKISKAFWRSFLKILFPKASRKMKARYKNTRKYFLNNVHEILKKGLAD